MFVARHEPGNTTPATTVHRLSLLELPHAFKGTGIARIGPQGGSKAQTHPTSITQARSKCSMCVRAATSQAAGEGPQKHIG